METTSQYNSNKTATARAFSECIEQEIAYMTCRENITSDGVPYTNIEQQTGPGFRSVCSNPICPTPNGHNTINSYEQFGTMEGKRDEVTKNKTAQKDAQVIQR